MNRLSLLGFTGNGFTLSFWARIHEGGHGYLPSFGGERKVVKGFGMRYSENNELIIKMSNNDRQWWNSKPEHKLDGVWTHITTSLSLGDDELSVYLNGCLTETVLGEVRESPITQDMDDRQEFVIGICSTR